MAGLIQQLTDITLTATPSVGSYLLSIDLDGVLKYKTDSGTISPVGVNFFNGGGTTSSDLGVISNMTITGTTSETLIYSQKIPANFYKIGDMFTFGPAIGAYFGYDSNGMVGPTGVPSPILLPSRNADISPSVYVGQNTSPQIGYANQTLTFSQSTSSGGGTGMEIQVTFQNDGYIIDWKMINGGNGYLPLDTITSVDLGDGTLNLNVDRTETSGDPNAKIRAYWSYTENGLDNLIKRLTLDYTQPTYQDTFSVIEPIVNVSGFRSALTQIIGATAIRQITSQETGAPYDFNISDFTIPDVTKDIWITLTCELEDSTTSLTTGLITVIRSSGDLDKFITLY
jgi:hypothetical protein